MLLAFPEDASGITLTDEEIADLTAAGEFMKTGAAYQEIQGKNPQTLGYGLTDSPAGLAGWIVEKFRAWTDNNGSPEDAVTRDQILTNLTVYWVTKTINSSTRLYCESQRTARFGPIGRVRQAPDRGRRVPRGDLPHPARVRRDRASTSCATRASIAAGTSPRSRNPTCWSMTSRPSSGSCVLTCMIS